MENEHVNKVLKADNRQKFFTYKLSIGIAQKISSRITLLRRLVSSGWDADAKTLRTAALSLVCSEC